MEIFTVAFPTRFYHFMYPLAYNFLYGIFLLILHFTEVNSRVYPPVDFRNNFGAAVGFGIGASIVAPFVVHSIIYVLYLLRNLIAKKANFLM